MGQDAERRAVAHVPIGRAVITKGKLARQMLERAFAAGVSVRWVIGDTVYGSDELRRWLEQRQQAYVLAVSSTHGVWTRGQQWTVADLMAQVPPTAWVRLSAGDGSQGPRWYEWVWVRLPYTQEESTLAQWVLIRRSLPDHEQPGAAWEYAYYRVYGPRELTLEDVVRVAGQRWTIEMAFEQAKGDVGLDHYEVRRYDAWYRPLTLVLVAHAILAVTRQQALQKGGPC